MDKNNTKEGGSWLIKSIIFLGIIAVILISLAIFRETDKKRQVQEEIGELQKQAEKIKRENAILSDKIGYLESRDYQEKEAKDKLNLQGPDEKVVIIEQEANGNKVIPKQDEIMEQEIIIEVSNTQKWWDYFFKY